jgi:transposase-like protein
MSKCDLNCNCKYCGSKRINNNGKVNNGNQRYYCRDCKRNYTITNRKYTNEYKIKIIKMYLEGMGIRSIERLEGVSNRAIIYWIRQYDKIIKDKLREQEVSSDIKDIEILEMDELVTHVKKNKTKSGYGLLLIDEQIKLLIMK